MVMSSYQNPLSRKRERVREGLLGPSALSLAPPASGRGDKNEPPYASHAGTGRFLERRKSGLKSLLW
ncbi:hypothetical protein FRZ61_23830 [Hypericibacter adhaerens]|uniref:Uncharacterized protein n=1 Tax=Hypericibacter adhaerens TaxID=2602016 RepID=A0A5J6MXI8_9PROT|nr:hypothetical protein FRZ61_23830 [Hypericibacter adhaerens]